MKKIHWFTIENLPNDLVIGASFEITDKEIIKQGTRVIRLTKGESIFIKNDRCGYLCEITDLAKHNLIVKIKEKKKQKIEKRFSLLFCIPKKDKFELILEKCTEIGVTDFYPVISDRTIKTNINTERASKIIQEASEQAQRLNTPVLHTISKLEDVLDELRPIIFDIEGTKWQSRHPETDTVRFLIGPEGGFSEREIKLFKEKGLAIYKIGETVLKTETAAIVVSGLLLN